MRANYAGLKSATPFAIMYSAANLALWLGGVIFVGVMGKPFPKWFCGGRRLRASSVLRGGFSKARPNTGNAKARAAQNSINSKT